MIYLITLLLIFNSIFLFFFNFFAKKINLYDFPDNQRKIHKKNIPLLGGTIFLFNILFYLSYLLIFQNSHLFEFFGFKEHFSTFVFIFSLILFFVIGYIDDKVRLPAKRRLFFMSLIILVNLLVNPALNISFIKLSFAPAFSIGNFSIFWTFLCFLLFINAFNFFDGINLQSAGLIYSICFFFLYKNIYFDFFLVILIANSFFAYLNYKSKTFLGNNGSFYIPFLLGSLFISSYNNVISLVADEIVILMLIPGLDLIRLFFQRIINKNNPMVPDQNHIHHYLIKKFSNTNSALIIQSLIWIPFILSQYIGYINLLLIAQTLCYFLIIAKYKN
jgi:UDP-GlcNAc:undecaprenyl-phosphate GlcNAc-1-phosphate transferase